MAEDRENPDDSEFPDDVGESTIAMDAPPFDPSVPLPISNAPPPFDPSVPLPISNGLPFDDIPSPSLPVATTSPGAAVAQTPPAPRTPRTAPVPFSPATSVPATAPRIARVAAAGAPSAAGAARAMRATRIGLAPPPLSAPPPTDASAPTAAPPPLSASSPAAVPAPNSASTPRAAPSPHAILARPGTDVRASSSVVPEHASVNRAESAPMNATSAMGEALFGLDASAADAARAAVSSGARPTPSERTPTSGVAFSRPDEDVPDDEASTRVPSRDHARPRDAHVVVGSDAVGDDATLAVAPGENEANKQRFAAFAQTMMAPGPEAAFPPQPMFPPAAADGARMHPSISKGGPPLDWRESPAWGAVPTSTSSPHLPASNPHPPAVTPQISFATHPGGGDAGPYPGQFPMHAPPPSWRGPAAPIVVPSPVSKPLLALILLGVVCVGIFVTGIVLFVTTKF